MAHPYADKIPGAAKARAMCKAEGGAVIDIADNLRNIQQSNAISRVLKGADAKSGPKAPVLPITPKK